MTQLVYDGRFEGLLTAIFELYERKIGHVCLVKRQSYQPQLTASYLEVVPDQKKAERVWNGLKQKLPADKRNEIYPCFLPELAEMESILVSFIRHVFDSKHAVEKDYSNKSVLAIAHISHRVYREKHRMEAFVRFQRTAGDVYISSIEPDFNVLPLIITHFQERYADQHWLIYDNRRNYGICYNKDTFSVQEVRMEWEVTTPPEFLPESVCHEEEMIYQSLWKSYFKTINIQVRNNRKLHIRHVPTRYWKYLTEKLTSLHCVEQITH